MKASPVRRWSPKFVYMLPRCRVECIRHDDDRRAIAGRRRKAVRAFGQVSKTPGEHVVRARTKAMQEIHTG